MTTELGYFIQALGFSDAQINPLLAHLTAVRPTTVSVMNNYQLARRIKDALPDCVVIHRDSTFEPPEDYSAEMFTQYLQSFPDKRIVLMLNCEQGFNPARVAMWIRLLDVAERLGYQLCVGNVSSGSVKSGQSSDPNEWQTTGAPLLRWLAQHTGHYLGVHNYTGPFLWIVTNGGWGIPAMKPGVIDWTKPQWHLGREAQGIMAACSTLGIEGLLERKFLVITEGLFDEMADLKNNPSYPYPDVKSNRWRYLIDAWSKWYPTQDPQDVLADQSIWAIDTIYKPLAFVVGVHFFTWGDAGGEWQDDRVDNAPRFLERMVIYAQKDTPPVKVYPAPMSKPDNAGLPTHVQVTFAAPYRNLRDGAGTNYRDIGNIHTGETFDIYHMTTHKDEAGLKWEWVEGTSAGAGWMNIDGIGFTNVPRDPVSPAPPAEDDTAPVDVVTEVIGWKIVGQRASVDAVKTFIQSQVDLASSFFKQIDTIKDVQLTTKES